MLPIVTETLCPHETRPDRATNTASPPSTPALSAPRLDAIHTMIENGSRAAFVDTGTNHSLPLVLEALKVKGLTPESVDYVMLTHIHLDHAGGASQMMKLFPNARLTVHPRGARHMADPSRLWHATVAVYGLENPGGCATTARSSRSRRSASSKRRKGSTLDFAGRELQFFDTPGHARHHVCIRDLEERPLFCRRLFRPLAYTELEADGCVRFHGFPTSSPSQFDPLPSCCARPSSASLGCWGPRRSTDPLCADCATRRASPPTCSRLIDAHVENGARPCRPAARAAPSGTRQFSKAGVRHLVAGRSAARQGYLETLRAANDRMSFLSMTNSTPRAWRSGWTQKPA